MAIAFVNVTDSNNGGASSSTNNFSHSVSGTDTILIVDCFSGYQTTSSVTYNGVSLTKIVEVADGISRYASSWYLINPTAGSNTVATTFSASTKSEVVARTYQGVKQTSPIDSFNSGSGTTNPITVNTTVVASNCWLIGFGAIDNGTDASPTQSSNKTDRASGTQGGSSTYASYCSSDSNGAVSTGSQGITFTSSGGATFYTKGITFSIAPAPPAPGDTIAFDAATNGGNALASSLTFSHTTSGSNRFLVVAVDDANATTSGVTYAGVSMTSLYTQTGFGESYWYLANPALGANNVVVTKSAGTASVGAVAASYTGVKQTSPIDSTSSMSTTTTSPTTKTTTVVANYCWLIGVSAMNNSSNGTSITSDRTSRITQNWFASGNTLDLLISDSNSSVSTGSQGTTFTRGSGTNNFQPGVFSIIPAGVSASNANFLMFM